MEDGFVKVISPIEDTPAFKAGIKPGDLIIKLDEMPVKGMTLTDAVKKMRGKPNTRITLTISRKGETVPVVVTLTRAIIRVQSVKSKTIEPGYVWVRVSQFQEATAENLVKQLDALFRSGQVKGLVLDLRNDPGGVLHARWPLDPGARHHARPGHRGPVRHRHRDPRARGRPAATPGER